MMTYLLQDHREDEAVVYQRHRRSVLDRIHDVLDHLITVGFVVSPFLKIWLLGLLTSCWVRDC